MKGRGDKSVARRKADKKIKEGDGGRVLAAMEKKSDSEAVASRKRREASEGGKQR